MEIILKAHNNETDVFMAEKFHHFIESYNRYSGLTL